ncbi:hypothetical protein ABIE44_003192 [Marmoricola sp. OAE513]|uniref:hypothetical protein n=1 Tax=Marmoricola sp. OAE513 TaxID=2817894 RepID=UPI001AE9D67C
MKKILGIVVITVVVTAAVFGILRSDKQGVPKHDAASIVEGDPVYVTSGHEMFSSETPADWAGNADYILDLSMTSEKVSEGDEFFVDRLADFVVHEVLYERAGAPTLPDALSMRVAGWMKGRGATLRPIVTKHGSSRMIPGHRYVVAIRYLEPRCNPDDDVEAGGWQAIGSWGVVPYDGKKVGEGEIDARGGQKLRDVTTLADSSVAGRVVADKSAIGDLIRMVQRADAKERDPQRGARVGC